MSFDLLAGCSNQLTVLYEVVKWQKGEAVPKCQILEQPQV
jgi:hypothetical protein